MAKQVLPQNKIVSHKIGAMKFGNIPPKQLLPVMADGRILGQVMETETAFSYHGFSKVGVNPKSETEDLFYAGGSKVQCKTLNFPKKSSSIIKSTLWDTSNGIRRSWKEWDEMHNQFFNEQDYLMMFNISDFVETGSVEILFISREDFKRETKNLLAEQIEAEHQRRTRKFNSTTKGIKTPDNESNVLPKWEYPAKMTLEMWNSFRS